VTSVLGLLEELLALATFLVFAVGAGPLGFPLMVALLGIPALLVSSAVVRWLPGRRSEDS
jgi:hypothetical protein